MITSPDPAVLSMLGRFLGVVKKLRIGYLANSPEHATALGLTKIQLLRAEKLVMAQAELEAEQIRSGLKTVGDFEVSIRFRDALPPEAPGRAEPILGTSELAVAVTSAMVEDRLQADVNVAKAAVHAAVDLAKHEGPTPEEEVDDDWLRAWRKGAEGVSSDDLQKLWGSLLAGEISTPGSYSLRTIQFMRSLSAAEVRKIAGVFDYALDGCFVWGAHYIDISTADLKFLAELNIIKWIDGIFYSAKSRATRPGGRGVLIRNHNLALYLDVASGLTVDVFAAELTSLGRELVRLGNFQGQQDYLEEMGRHFQRSNIRYLCGDYASLRQQYPEAIEGQWKFGSR